MKTVRCLRALTSTVLSCFLCAATAAVAAEPGAVNTAETMSPREPSVIPVAARVERSSTDVGAAIARGIEELARKVLPVSTFPIAGEFNWGQSGARYGSPRSGHAHEGQDVFARRGTPLVAVADGRVVEMGDDAGRGNYVAIHDPVAGETYVYLHMNAPSRVLKDQQVSAGQRVGEVGCSGSCFGDHLHLEIRRGKGTTGASIDPWRAMHRWADASDARATLPPGAA